MNRKTTYHYLKDNVFVPIVVVNEWRNNIRFSITKKGAYLRIPPMLSRGKVNEEVNRMNAWIQRQIEANANLKSNFTLKTYQNGQQLIVGSRTYTLTLTPDHYPSFRARLKDGVISINYPENTTLIQINEVVPTLLSRIVGKDFYVSILQRVIAINGQFFQLEINKVSLKYNRSNWGSCSGKGNINLSTRLLFAPDKVIDYVIIHELAHRVEMNHSPRFYEIVRKAMPDYREQEKWLKQNSHLCDF